jgi:Fe-S oxidoreductase
MRTIKITEEERIKAFAPTKKPEVIEKQKLGVRYHIEDCDINDRPRRFLEAFAVILKHSNYRMALEHYSLVAARCSICAVACQVYQATGKKEDIPCYRSELLLNVYRRHFTLGGMLKGRISGSGYLTDEKIQEMAESYWNCTACRRCVLECPMGVDHGLITHLARYILSEIGIVPRALVVSVREQLEGASKNTSAVPLPALKDMLEFLEDEMLEEKSIKIKFPMDVRDSDYSFFSPVSDYLMEAETLMGIAAVFTATGGSWTIGSEYFDAINYGLFYNDRILERIIKNVDKETRRLNTNKILIGECGHASRVAKNFMPTFCGGENSKPVVSILEYTYKAWKDGKLKLNPEVITEKVSYHDPCNFARNRWIVNQPREVLKSFCKNYIEMTPSGENNICCGGGGGAVSIDEIRPYRTTIAGKLKADQIRKAGCEILVAPCANCKKQLRELVEDQKIDCKIVGFHDLIYKAIIFDDSLSINGEEPSNNLNETSEEGK